MSTEHPVQQESDIPGHGFSGVADADVYFMRRALRIGEQGRRITAPNPWVGAVIVAADGVTVLGEGYHKGPGKPHAEVEAVRDAESKGVVDFSGATMYTTLEPCHRGPGKRTPPCDELVVAKQFRRCVIGHVDPDPTFGGAGVGHMEAAGIQVTTGVAEEEARSSFRCYFHHRKKGRPYCVLKIATSIDGCIGCADKTSQWITQAEARQDSHQLRADSNAILVGSGTALADKPSLTVRLPKNPCLPVQPLRVVLDTKGQVLDGPLLDTSVAPTLMFTSAAHCSPEARTRWKASGVECVDVPLEQSGNPENTDGPHLDLKAVLSELATRGVLQLMVEGGAVVQGAFLRQGFAQELRVYLGATLLGGTAQPWARVELTKTIGDAKFWQLRDLRRLGNDVCLEYELPENENA